MASINDYKYHQRQLVDASTQPRKLMVMYGKDHQGQLVDASTRPTELMVMDGKDHQRQLVDVFDLAYRSNEGPVVNEQRLGLGDI